MRACPVSGKRGCALRVLQGTRRYPVTGQIMIRPWSRAVYPMPRTMLHTYIRSFQPHNYPKETRYPYYCCDYFHFTDEQNKA